MSTQSWEFQPRVDKGCKLLDERLGPEWVEKIDLKLLDLQSACACILGQTSIDIVGRVGNFYAAANVLFPDQDLLDWSDAEKAETHGFALDNSADYPALTECWRNTILSRRAES